MERQQGCGHYHHGVAGQGGGLSDGNSFCMDALECCVRGYLVCQSAASRCFECVLDCGGLLRVSDKELRSWGVREGEQPARYRGACGDQSRRDAVLARCARSPPRAPMAPSACGMAPAADWDGASLSAANGPWAGVPAWPSPSLSPATMPSNIPMAGASPAMHI